MIMEEVYSSFLRTMTELIVKKSWKKIWPLLVSGIAGLATIFLATKNKLAEHPNVSLALLAIMATITVLCLTLLIRMYLRHGRFQEAYGAFWDKSFNMRCLSCRKPLKHSSTDISIFHCSDPKCDSKHVLRDGAGNKMSREEAINRMKGDQSPEQAS